MLLTRPERGVRDHAAKNHNNTREDTCWARNTHDPRNSKNTDGVQQNTLHHNLRDYLGHDAREPFRGHVRIFANPRSDVLCHKSEVRSLCVVGISKEERTAGGGWRGGETSALILAPVTTNNILQLETTEVGVPHTPRADRKKEQYRATVGRTNEHARTQRLHFFREENRTRGTFQVFSPRYLSLIYLSMFFGLKRGTRPVLG